MNTLARSLLTLIIAAGFCSLLGGQVAESQPAVDPLRGGFEAADILEALVQAWPDRFSKPERIGDDLAIRLDETWYRWAGGRLLPVDLPGPDEAWSPWPFYPYPREAPQPRKLTAEEKARLDAHLSEDDKKPPRRYPGFYDQLWHSPDEEKAWDLMKTLRFFGKEILINPDLLEEVAAVERALRAAARTDEAVAAWIASIGTAEGYVWRSVAGTRSRSMHSYGAAIDIVPAKTKNLSWYWLDARWAGLAWYELPLSRRITVPPRVVEIFERYGFVWGGKWFYWDLVHFEYRPEILYLNGMTALYQNSLP